MARSFRFVRRPGLEKKLQAQPAYQHAIKASAEAVATEANQIAEAHGAPWMPDPNHPSGTDPIVLVEHAGVFYVLNTDYGAQMMELGTVNNPPYAPLRLAVRAAGLTLRDSGR